MTMSKLFGFGGLLLLMFLAFALSVFGELAWKSAAHGNYDPAIAIAVIILTTILTFVWKKSGRPIS